MKTQADKFNKFVEKWGPNNGVKQAHTYFRETDNGLNIVALERLAMTEY